MTDHQTLHMYLEGPLRKSAEAGDHNFINLMIEVLEKSQFRVVFHDVSEVGNHNHSFSISHMKEPPNNRGLVFRRAYHYPFWQIEQTNKRWDWDVARAVFDPDLNAPDAARFYGFWQKRQFKDAPNHIGRDGYIYVPLQGRLNQHRSFQSCSPIEMIEYCLDHDLQRNVIATLHPNEQYSELELAKLEALQSKHSRLTVDMGDMVRHLQNCDYVVTQNSSAAFAGYFFGKPALLFGRIDFHHIAEVADMNDLANSFANVMKASPDYAKYIWWFWQHNCINGGRADAQEKIAARFKRFGWPID
jgi:hypothetical protein